MRIPFDVLRTAVPLVEVPVLLVLVYVALYFRRRYFQGAESPEPLEQPAPSRG